MELQSYPSLDTAKLYASWGQDISYMVNYSITPAQYKEITGLDFATEEAPASESTSSAPVASTSDSVAGSLSESTSTSESVAQ